MKFSFVLFFFISVGDCCHAQKLAKQAISPSDKVEIEKLISRLGSTSFRERRTASRKLTSKGTAILPILQNALKNESSEAKKRLENLIRDIQLIETERLLQQLIEKPDSIPDNRLPFLGEFRKFIGNDKKSLKFYAEMYRGEKELFYLHTDKKKYKARTEEVIGELYDSYRDNNVLGISHGNTKLTAKICAVFFLQSVTKPEISRTAHSYLYSLSYYQDLQQTLRNKKNSPQRKTIACWVRKGTTAYPYQKSMLALQYDFKEGLEPSLEMLKDRTQAGSLQWYPLMVVAKFGNREQISNLEKLFNNEQELFGRAGNAAETYKCLTRDSALLAAILITKQDPKDYGFRKLQKSTVYLYNPGTTGFETENDRKTAFKKWKAWKKKNIPAKAKK